MIDLENFKNPLIHKISQEEKNDNKEPEKSNFMAYQLDDEGGLKLALGFESHQVSCVDYFYFFDNNPHKIYLLELTDLRKEIIQCYETEIYLLEFIDDDNKKLIDILHKKPKKSKELIRHKTWFELTSEFQKKWLGSMAIIERYYRYNHSNCKENPKLQLIIVVKNYQDSKDKEIFENKFKEIPEKLAGMLGKVVILNTENVISHFNDLGNK